MEVEVKENISFLKLCELEPGLADLFLKAKHYRQKEGRYCPIPTWYKQFKPELIKLVGWWARMDNPVLKSKAAYDLAYQTIDNALPKCPKHCHGCD